MRSPLLSTYPLSSKDTQRIDQLYESLRQEADLFLGYPCNGIFDYSPLYKFLQFPLNNVGDPYLPSNYHLNTHEIEREVLDIFQGLTQAPAEETWGYITNGGTEGNHYGLFLARELHPKGIVYYSQDAHYSIDKILRCLGMQNIMIRSLPNGQMDLVDLRETLNIHRDAPAILCVTIGTTMKGAVDNLAGIQEIFRELALKNYYIHADAALGGMILPFIKDAPPWNFEAGIDSIAISGHKMIGSPVPCGIALAKKSNVDRIAQSVEYIDTLDTTLTGSRNALSPLFMWYAFHTIGVEGFRQWVAQCLEVADYAVHQLNNIDVHAWRHPYSNTVVFDRPVPEVTRRWQLACYGSFSHLITMPHVTRAQIDQLVKHIQQTRLASIEPVTSTLKEMASTDSSEQDIIVVGSTNNLLTKISSALASAGLMIEGITAIKTDEASIIRLKVDDRPKALEILKQNLDMGRSHGQSFSGENTTSSEILSRLDYQSVSNDALLIQLEDKPGTLAQFLKHCCAQEIPIRSVRFLWRGKDKAVVEVASPESDKLKKLLMDRVLLQ